MAPVLSSAIKGMVRSILTMLKWAAILLGTIVATVLLIPLGMILLGYRVNVDSGAVAELAAKKGNVELCRSIINYGFFGPTSGESRAHCVYRYAKLTSDPSACELLMPSEYGLACISNLWPEVSGHVACGWNHVDTSLFECRNDSGLLQQGRNCEDFVDNQKQFSACLSYMAERAKEFDLCAKIPDLTIRSFCKTKMGAWEKYPSLRGSFYFGQSSPQ